MVGVVSLEQDCKPLRPTPFRRCIQIRFDNRCMLILSLFLYVLLCYLVGFANMKVLGMFLVDYCLMEHFGNEVKIVFHSCTRLFHLRFTPMVVGIHQHLPAIPDKIHSMKEQRPTSGLGLVRHTR